ncbi:procathepsin L-like [Dermacentor variabilis]|uniref:procathepsin L-like n=1 Tax=Dermacentor variabilis TaxID=34621 RepID=UPI003F5B86C2
MILHMLLLSAALAVAFAVTAEQVIRSEWQAFKTKHGRNYTSAHEEILRFKIFTENSLFIARHNEKYVKGLVSYSLGMNQFGDMLHHEFVQLTNCYKPGDTSSGRSTYLPPDNVDDSVLPESVDWRKKGYVTPVKNQGQCGSCWAFSTTGSLEGQHFKKTGKLVSLSEQNLVDCSRDYGNNGCNGGSMENAFDYIKANGGIDTEKSYPYHGRDEPCKFKKADVGATVTGKVGVKEGSEEDLKNAVATVGPVSVAIDASQRSFQFYRTGVYDEHACSSKKLDHGVLAVGYGVLNGTKYWLVKNSWAEEWGEKGYIYMSRDKNNQCGIATDATYPLV